MVRGERRKEEEGLSALSCPSHTSLLVLKMGHPHPQVQSHQLCCSLLLCQGFSPAAQAPVPTQKEGLVNNTRYNDKISVLLTPIFFPHLFVSICHSFLFLFCLPVRFCSVPQSSSSVLFVYLCLGFLVFSFFTSSHCLTIYIFFFCLYESQPLFRDSLSIFEHLSRLSLCFLPPFLLY